MQKITIKNIEIFGYHGVYDEEIKNGQYFYINLIYSFDFKIDSVEDEIMSVQDFLLLRIIQKQTEKI